MLGKRKICSRNDNHILETVYNGCSDDKNTFMEMFPLMDMSVKLAFWNEKQNGKNQDEERYLRAKRRKLDMEDHNDKKNDSHKEKHEDEPLSLVQGLVHLQKANVDMSSLSSAIVGASNIFTPAQFEHIVSDLPVDTVADMRVELIGLINTLNQSKSEDKENDFESLKKGINQNLSYKQLDTLHESIEEVKKSRAIEPRYNLRYPKDWESTSKAQVDKKNKVKKTAMKKSHSSSNRQNNKGSH